MAGFLPPASAVIDFSWAPVAAARVRPVSVDPVKQIMSVWSTSCGPIRGPGPATTCQASAGIPAARSKATPASALSTVSEAGLCTTVLPASSAASPSQMAIVSG